MHRDTLQTLLVLPLFLVIEFGRAVHWAARAIDEPDRDGPLLRALIALLVSVLAVVPSPVWRLMTFIAWAACIPVRGMLWLWGIRRENIWKRFPKAVNDWYVRTRRAKTRRGRQRRSKREDDSDSEVTR